MHRMVPAILTVLLSFSICAQEMSAECPKLEIIAPRWSIAPKTAATFVLNISEDKPEEFRYEWSVENGEIANGQGTRVVDVSSTYYGSKAKVIVSVLGLPKGCVNTTFAMVEIDRKPEWGMIDEWGEMRENDQRGRLDLFFYDLANNDGQMGLIIIGTPRTNQPRIAKRRLKLILEQAELRKFNPTRIVFCVEAGSQTAMRLYRFRPEFQEMFPYPDCTPMPLAKAKVY